MLKRVGLFLFCIACPALTAAEYLGSVRVAELRDLQSMILNERFPAATIRAKTLQQEDPEDPVAPLFLAAVYMAEMTAREEKLYDDDFKNLTDATVALVDSLLLSAEGRKAAWLCLWRGHAQAYRALWESRFGSWISAIKYGVGAKDDYKRGLEYDSTLYDLYVGLGSFHYWKSAKAGVLRWLGIFSDDMQLGIAELHLAADSGIVFDRAAREALIWIWLDRQEYDSVIVTATAAANRYVEGAVFLWPLARAYQGKHRYRQALNLYRDIRDRVADDPGNYYNLIECDYQIAKCYEGLNQTESAVNVARRVRDYLDDVSKRIQGRHRRNIAYLKRLARL